MGLTDDIYNAFIRSMINEEDESNLTDFQKDKIEELSENLKEAFINFLVKQTFTIKEMKALVEVETITTSTTLTADVEDSVSIKPGVPVATTGTPSAQSGTTTQPGYINKLTGREGVTIPKLDLGKDEKGTQGGNLESIGHAYIGTGPADRRGEPNSSYLENKVKINREDIVEE